MSVAFNMRVTCGCLCTWNCFRVFVRPGCAVSASWSSSLTEVILEEEEEGVSKVNKH
jgi:hypothetical protein